MVIAVGHIKGGVGKTTFAWTLAVRQSEHGRKVLLVDADDQESAQKLADKRAEHFGTDNKFTTLRLRGKNVRSEVVKLMGNYDDVIIDCGGRDTDSQRAAIGVCDVYIVPTRPRPLELDATVELQKMLEIVQAGRQKPARVFVFLNQCDVRGMEGRANVGALNYLHNEQYIKDDNGNPTTDKYFEVIDDLMIMRMSWGMCFLAGLSIYEEEPHDEKAIEEFETFFNTLTTKIYEQSEQGSNVQ